MTDSLEKWLNDISYEQIRDGISRHDYFDENITCWIPIPYYVALEVIKQDIRDIQNPISWLHNNTLRLELEYHTDGYPTATVLDYDIGINCLQVDDTIRNKIDSFYKRVLEEKQK